MNPSRSAIGGCAVAHYRSRAGLWDVLLPMALRGPSFLQGTSVALQVQAVQHHLTVAGQPQCHSAMCMQVCKKLTLMKSSPGRSRAMNVKQCISWGLNLYPSRLVECNKESAGPDLQPPSHCKLAKPANNYHLEIPFLLHISMTTFPSINFFTLERSLKWEFGLL